ncbi:HPF/RaiA family ribosome-associated protein [Ramlibacter sp.]|uniref:HPF/RaiA family ribosome-associated protein n=1 Tax=Ramlibacter sp. TaxID=1917967 RepID=UPI003D09FA39
MHVQVNTSNGIDNTETLEKWATDYLNDHFARFSQDITAIEVHLTDENHGTKGGADDKRCMLEARLTGHAPVAVTHHAANQDLAFRGAATKLSNALEHAFGKQDRAGDHRARETIRRETTAM